MNNTWSFPINQDDSQTGISDSGIETFREDIYSSLAREICQNSMDAKLTGKQYAKVGFKLSYIDQTQLPGNQALIDAFSKSKKHGEDLQDAKTIDFSPRGYRSYLAIKSRSLESATSTPADSQGLVKDLAVTGLT